MSRSIVGDLALTPARLRAVASRSRDRAESFRAGLDLERAYDNLDDLLLDAAVDIVYLGTPHSTHADLAIRALEAGKHVLVEKPLGVNAAEVERVAAVALSTGRFAMEAMWMKFHPYYQALLDDARSGSIGELTAVRASFGLPFGPPDSTRWGAGLASSTLLDQGIYPVTLACDLFGEPASVSATADLRADGVDLSIHSTLGFGGGRFAQLAASMVGYLDPSASISGTGGWLSVPAPFWATTGYARHSGGIGAALMTPEVLEFEREGLGYVPMLRAVTSTIEDGLLEHPVHPLASTIRTARVLDLIRTAATSLEFAS